MPFSLAQDPPSTMVHLLAFLSLFGLLFASGLEISFQSLRSSLKRQPLIALLLANFLLIPSLGAAIATGLDFDPSATRSLILLAAAPFAPVVPLFVKMSRGHQALAISLTGIMPLFSSILTPPAAYFGFWLSGKEEPLLSNPLELFGVTFASITLPLAIGLLLHHHVPNFAKTVRKPIEWGAEVTGFLSLAYLFYLEYPNLATLRGTLILGVILFCEIAFLAGWLIARGTCRDRLAIAFGTGNRNIGLGILLMTTPAHPDPTLSPMVLESLLMLACGLINVAMARCLFRK